MTEPLLMSVREWARAEGVGRDTAYQLVREGRLRAVFLNRRILIPRSELEDFPRRETEGGDRVNDTAAGNGRGPHRTPPDGGLV